MFKKKSNNIISRVLVFLMVMMTALSYLPAGLSPVVESAEAVSAPSVEDHMNNTVSYFEENDNELNDWQAICALVGAGVDILDSSKWTLPDWDTNTIEIDDSASKYGSRMLALIAMDKNPENIWGRNLVEELVVKQDDSTGSFGTISDQMYAMHALEIVGADYDRDLAVEWLLSQQDTEKGGYGYSAGTSDPDITGMVLRILGDFMSDSDVSNSVDYAIEYLKGVQLSTGGFASYGEENANTIAVIISGLVSVGEDVQSVFWTENENTIVDALYKFELGDYSYTWLLEPEVTNGLSTTQSLAALGDVVAGDSGLNRIEYDADTVAIGLRVEGISDTMLNTVVSYEVLNGNSPTVEEVIRYAFEEEEMSYEITTSAMGPYLERVDGEISATFGGWDGWLYLLNGESGMGIGYDKVVDGDEIVFYYGEYAPGTLIPEVSVSPVTIYEGNDITFEVTGTYVYDYDTDATTTEAIEFAKIELDGTMYTTDENGQVTVTGGTLAVGTYDYRVTKDEPGTVPGIVRTDGLSLTVKDFEITNIDLRIEGITETKLNDEIAYIGYPNPTVEEVLRYALDEADMEYEIVESLYGALLNSIEGEESATFGGWDGWLYLLNGESGMGIGYDKVVDGDEIVFYYGEYAPGTLIPEVSVSPVTIYEGDDITFEVTGTYVYDYDTYATTTEAIEFADIELNGTMYTTDENGLVTVTGGTLAVGTYDYRVTKDEPGTVPGIVRTDGLSLTVKDFEITNIDLRIEGITETKLNDEIAYIGYPNPTVEEVLRYALDEADMEYEIVESLYGALLNSIEGEESATFGGWDGWLYLLNGESGMGIGYDKVVDGDEIVFYYGEYAPGTLIPEVSVSPVTIYEGDDITFEVTGTYVYDYDTYATTTEAIEFADIELDGTIYTTDADGQATVDGNVLSSGTYEYRVTKDEVDTAPGIVRTDWESLTVKKHTSSISSFKVNIAVIGQDGELLYGPKKETISENSKFGETAMSVLYETGLDYEFKDDTYGFVEEIEGQKNLGQNGWMYTIDGEYQSKLAIYTDINGGEKVLWWYSDDMNAEAPDWPSSSSSFAPVPAVDTEQVIDTLEDYSGQLAGGTTLLNSDKMMTEKEAEELAGDLKDNEVSLSEKYEGKDTVLSDMEVSMLVREDALEGDVRLTIKEVKEEDNPKQFAVKLGSSVYEFGPDGSKFDEAVVISITIPIDENTDLESLKPAWFDEESKKWIIIPCVMDLETGMITFEIDHFTEFAVIETEKRVEFNDVDDTMAWARDAVEILAGAGVVNGTGNGYEPQRSITRAEFVKIIVEALELEKSEADGTIFADVNADDWFAEYVECGYNNDIVSGDPDGSFRPDDKISRNEIAVVLSRLGYSSDFEGVELEFGDAADIPEWASAGVEFANSMKLMNGYQDNTFKGDNPLSRAEAAVVVYRYINYSLNN